MASLGVPLECVDQRSCMQTGSRLLDSLGHWTLLTPAALARWQEGFPHAETARFDDAGHWPHEAAADEASAAIADFPG